MKYIAIVLASLLVGCTTVPVERKFPEVPAKLLEKCPRLQKLDDEPKLSDVARTVTLNYTTYYECAVKHDGIVEWYQIQKRIFEDVK